MITNFFSLRRSKRTLRHIHRLYKRKAKSLDLYTKGAIEGYLQALRSAILVKNGTLAKQIARDLEKTSAERMPKTLFDKVYDFFVGISFALVIAILIRTMWFELYTIPSGSMRPTLKEEDYLVVSKTDYGINVPLQEKHFYFDPSLVQRGSIVVFNSANIDMDDADTTYFYLFPGKKQMVKRLIGKPGDSIYFYGGEIYGVDAEGREITEFRNFNNLEHIPFIRFEGKTEMPTMPKNGDQFTPVTFYQMNQPVAKLQVNAIGRINGEMIPQKGAAPFAQYSDLWGMKHYATARLLTKSQLERIHPQEKVEEGLLYLELTHHPSLQNAQLVRDEYQRLRPHLHLSYSLIPLQQKHIDEIAAHMTTCRFGVKNGIAYRLGWDAEKYSNYMPRLSDVPDGIYEIQDGKAYQLPFKPLPFVGIFTNGYAKQLPLNHPLYRHDAERVHLFYNLGIEFLHHFLPTSKNQKAIPSRYAYFKDQNLYLLDAPILTKEDPTLIRFVQEETERQSISTSVHPYFPFIDMGPPTLEEIQKNGIRVPEKMYLALGDNHAMSADSRQFGFVPEDNLKGGVSFLFAPPGPRWGFPPQPAHPHATFPNITVWVVFMIIAMGTSLYYRKKLKAPLQF